MCPTSEADQIIKGTGHALPVLRKYRHTSKRQPPGRGSRIHSPPPLLSGVRQKRPIDPERIDQMISGIVRRLESMGETDIGSKQIGEIVMEALARIDTVAYVRFASVYKNFQAADDFDKFVQELRPDTPTEE